MKRVTPRFLRSFTCGKFEWNIGEAMEQEGKLWEFTYLGDRVSAFGRYDAAVAARTQC